MDTVLTASASWERTLCSQGVRELTAVAEVLDSAARDSNEICGFGVLKRYSDRPGYLYCAETSVYLRTTAVGQGVGKAIKLELIRYARLAGYRHLVAKLFTTNERAIRYNLSLGYRVVGTQHEIGYTAATWRDITILELAL